MGNDINPVNLAQKATSSVHKAAKSTVKGGVKAAKTTANTTVKAAKTTTNAAKNPQKIAKSWVDITKKAGKSTADFGINTAKSAANTGVKMMTDPQATATSFRNGAKFTANASAQVGKSIGKSAKSLPNKAKAFPNKAYDIAKNPQKAFDAVDNVYQSSPMPIGANPIDVARVIQGDADAMDRVCGMDKIEENLDIYCEMAENPPNLEDIKECDVGVYHIDGDGVAVKPQYKYGVGGDNFSAHIGCDDIRDGLSFGFGIDSFVKIHSEGNSYKKVVQDMKCKAKYKRGSEQLLKAFRQSNKLVMDVLNVVGINIESEGIWFVIDVKISRGMITGVSAKFKGGWTDTEGYRMVGVGGKLAAFGLDVFAGIHTSGSRLKVEFGCSGISLKMIVQLDHKKKSISQANNVINVDEHKLEENQWECKYCTFLNHMDLSYCEACMNKPDGASVS